LRDMPDEEDRNRQLLELVCAHSFVARREDGGYVYSDSIGEAVLTDWRASDKKQKQFVEINNRLTGFYEDQYLNARKSGEDLGRVSSVMRDANIARYRKLASIAEKRLLLPLLEALYHSLLASPADGFSFFTTKFYELEGAGRLIVCQTLISTTRDFLLRLPPDQQDPMWAAWLEYFELRISGQLPPVDFQRAEEKLRGLSANTDLEAKLRIWALTDLAIVQEAQLKLRDAINTRKELLTLAKESGEDAYNLPLYYNSLGNLYLTLGELDHAIENYRTAIEESETTSGARLDMRVLGRLNLSGVYCEAGQWDKGFESGVEAFCLARTEFTDSQSIQSAATDRLMNLLLSCDQLSADAVAAEYISLNQAVEQWNLAALERYIAALDNSGRTGFAEVQLRRLREETERSERPQQFRSQLLLREALVCESRGRNEEAIQIYSELLGLSEGGQVDNWSRAASLSNRGRLLAIQGRWEAAEGDLHAALGLWESYGHETVIAFNHIFGAYLLRCRGLLSKAQEELDKASKVFLVGIRAYVEEFHVMQGDVYFAQGRWREAQKHFSEAREISAARKKRRPYVKALQKLSAAAVEEGEWASAAEFAALAEQGCYQLAALDAYRPSAADEEANRKNAEGIRLFCEGADMTQACELFRSALEDVPANFWYRLNLAFANAKRGNWLDAAQDLEQAIAMAPDPMRTARLYRCRQDYLVKYAEKCYRNRDYSKAVQVIKDALGSAGPFLPTIDLLHLQVILGDYLWSAGRPDEAGQAYVIGEQNAESLHLEYELIKLATRRAFLEAANGQLFTAVASITPYLARIASEEKRSLADAFAEAANLIQTPRQFHGCAEFIRVLATAEDISSEAAEIANEQLLDLSERLYRPVIYPLGRSKTRQKYLPEPVVTPIELWIAADLAPSDDAPGIRWMIEKGFPEMRDRVLRDMGVRIPGVSIRTNENNPPGGYFHSLFEVPLYLYMVYEGKRFCPEAAKCREIGLSGLEAVNYGPTGGNGLWVDESEWSKAKGAGLPLRDLYEYMTSHTESVIRARLISFFGVQELRNTLNDWIKGGAPFAALSQDQKEARQILVETATHDDRAFLRLLSILRALLRENVPILRLDRILTEFTAEREGEERDVGEAVEQIRMLLREDLPGNRDQRKLITIPEKLEYTLASGVYRQDGKVFFALPPEQVQEFLSEVRPLLTETSEIKPALIVSQAGVRPLVSAILALEFPTVPILARGELADAVGKEQL